MDRNIQLNFILKNIFDDKKNENNKNADNQTEYTSPGAYVIF